MSRAFTRLCGTILASLLASNLQAAQIIENADKTIVPVTVSAREQNRLSIEGRQLRKAIPPEKGVLVAVKDTDTGVLYFSLADPLDTGTISLFVVDDQNITYRLLLTPGAVPAEDIVIRPPAGAAPRPAEGTAEGRTLSYQRHAKDLVLMMADEQYAERVDIIEVHQEIPLWTEARLVLQRKYLDGEYVGEKYRLTNVSPAEMVLAEQELYRRGVIAVAIEYHTLLPGDSTEVFIVRGRGQHE